MLNVGDNTCYSQYFFIYLQKDNTNMQKTMKFDENKLAKLICLFLRNNNSLEKYCYNVLNSHNEINLDRLLFKKLSEKTLYIIKNRLSHIDINNLDSISMFFEHWHTAFYWNESLEGCEYWIRLHYKWCNYFNENMEKVLEK